MNKRLQCIYSHVPPGIGVIDVGTDHGYLPVALAKHSYPGKLFASDINPGPLQAAKRSARQSGVSERICFLLCDGLELCPPNEIDCIVIAGMGGDHICGILDRAEWCMDERYLLILQPMTRAEVLRYWLSYNEFEILAEDLVEDGGTVYPVLLARFGGKTHLKDAELFCGSAALLAGHPLFPRVLKEQTLRFQKILEGYQHSRAARNPEREALFRGILNELTEMECYGERK